MKLKLFTLAIILINYTTIIAGEQSFYSGTIIGAQYSKMKPEIKNLDYYESLVGKEKVTRKSIKETKSRDLAYLAISVKMELGRTLSTHDYFVMGDGMPFACAAIQVGALPFDASYQEIDIENPEKIYTLLFVVDSWFKKYDFQIVFRHAFNAKNQKKIIVKSERLRGALINLSGEKLPVAEVAKPEAVIAKPVVAQIAKPVVAQIAKPVVAQIAKPVVVEPVKIEPLDINKATSQQLKDIGVSGFIAGEIVSRRSKGQYSDMKSLLDRFSDATSCQPALKELDGKIIFNVTAVNSTGNTTGKINPNTATKDEMKKIKIKLPNTIFSAQKAKLNYTNFEDFISKIRVWQNNSRQDFGKRKNKDDAWFEKQIKGFEKTIENWKENKDKFTF